MDEVDKLLAKQKQKSDVSVRQFVFWQLLGLASCLLLVCLLILRPTRQIPTVAIIGAVIFIGIVNFWAFIVSVRFKVSTAMQAYSDKKTGWGHGIFVFGENLALLYRVLKKRREENKTRSSL